MNRIMRYSFLIILSFLSFHTPGRSQQFIARMNKDSLKNQLRFEKDTVRINTLNFLSTRILFGEQTPTYLEEAGILARQALDLSTALNYGKGQGNALLNQGIINVGKTFDLRPTLVSLQRALQLLKNAGDSFAIANGYGVTGDCYHFLGNNNKAVIYYDSGVHLFQELGDTISSVWLLVNKAHSNSDLGNYAESYKIYHNIAELTPEKDTLLRTYTFCGMAALFVAAGLPEMAIEYMYKVRGFFPGITNDHKKGLPWQINWVSRLGGEAFLQLNQIDSAVNIARFLNLPLEKQDPPDNLFYGNLYAALGQYKKALFYYRHGYDSSRHNFFEIGHAAHANGLASAYVGLKNYPQAIHYAKEAVLVSKKMPALLEEKKAYGTLSKIYADTKNYTKAYYYAQLYKSLNDSLAPEVYKRKISLIQMKDQLELQKKEARLLMSQNQLSQQQIKMQESTLKRRSLLLYIFVVALMVMILFGFLISRNIKLNRKKVQMQQWMENANASRKLTELENEKSHLEMQALRAQMNPHFIFNCLSSVNRFILINKIDEASDYLTKFSRLIRMALQNSEKPLITLESELDALRLYLDLERLRFKNGFNYNITFTNSIDCHAVYIPPMLIQPFAENAIWHGLMHKKGTGRLDIQLCATDKTLTCDIIDDGIGRNRAAALNSRTAEKNKSMGVGITEGRLALLNKSKNGAAVLKIEDLTDDTGNDCGTKVRLTIPYRNLTEIKEYV